MDDLKPYPEYRDTEVRWLGCVPHNWGQHSLWTISRLRNELNPGNVSLLSVFLDRGVIPYGEGGGQVHAPSQDLSKYQVVHPGDFVLNNQQAWRGSVGVSRYYGIISPAYIVLKLAPELNAMYANYLMRSPSMVDQFVVASKGVGDIQRQIYWPYLKNVQVPIPPPDEQAAIVRFLNHANLRIEKAVRAKRKVIALLNEQKQVIIHRAVTRGIDSNVRLKPSSIQWLGDIPEHWEDLRSKYVFHEVDERSVTGAETHLSMSQKYGLIPNSQIQERRLVSESYIGAKLCRAGDLVLNRLKAHLGVFALAPEPGLISPDYTVFRPARPMVARYFEAMYRTPACRVELRKRAKGIVQGFWRLYTDDFYDIRVPVPPLEEQEKIMQYLDRELSSINTVIAGTEREIDLLREYRTRLTSDVVTGKLDVRQAAARLPDEFEELDDTLTDESDELEEIESEDA